MPTRHIYYSSILQFPIITFFDFMFLRMYVYAANVGVEISISESLFSDRIFNLSYFFPIHISTSYVCFAWDAWIHIARVVFAKNGHDYELFASADTPHQFLSITRNDRLQPFVPSSHEPRFLILQGGWHCCNLKLHLDWNSRCMLFTHCKILMERGERAIRREIFQ